jgi:hypothetical protein
MSTHPGDAKRIVATAECVGRACPYCRFPLKSGGAVVLCGYCQSAHHADCWADNGGCAVVACAGGPGKALSEPPTALIATAPTPAVPAGPATTDPPTDILPRPANGLRGVSRCSVSEEPLDDVWLLLAALQVCT